VIEGGEDHREPTPPSAMEELLKGLQKTPESEMDDATRQQIDMLTILAE
jgi:hypothetical protein